MTAREQRQRSGVEIDGDIVAACQRLGDYAVAAQIAMDMDRDGIARTAAGLLRCLRERKAREVAQ